MFENMKRTLSEALKASGRKNGSDNEPSIQEMQQNLEAALALANAGDLDGALELAPTCAVLDAYLTVVSTTPSPYALRSPDALPYVQKLLDAQLSRPEWRRFDAGTTHSVLGAIYESLQDHDRAFDEYMEALEADRRQYGDAEPQVATDYLSLGRICEGRDAVDCLTKALHILDRLGTTDVRVLFSCCYNLAWAHADRGDYEHAHEYISRTLTFAQTMKDDKLPQASDAYLDTLRLCAYIAFCQNEQQRCGAYGTQLANIVRSLPEQQRVQRVLDLIFVGTQAVLAGNAVAAAACVDDYLNVLPAALQYVCTVAEEGARESYIRAIRDGADFAYGAFFDLPGTLTPSQLYAMELVDKNANAEITYQQMRLASSEDGQRLAQAAERLSLARENHAAMDMLPDVSELERVSLEHELNAAEAEFAICLQQTRFSERFTKASPEDVQRGLGTDAAVIEYSRWTRYEMCADATMEPQIQPHPCYLAYIVRNDRIGLIDLGSCEGIDAGIEGLIAMMPGGGAHDGTGEFDDVAIGLYRRVILPCEGWLEGVSAVHIVPDDALYRLPFELLEGADGMPMNERWSSISYLSSGRSLTRFRHVSRQDDIRIVANPLFDLGNMDRPDESDGHLSPTSRELRDHMRTEGIRPLPFTEVEADGIAALFRSSDISAVDHATVITGKDANVQALLSETGAQKPILHIATHGFAFPTPNDSDKISPLRTRSQMMVTGESPLSRCGLLFAGVCNWLNGEDLPACFGNGIVTARDVLSLDMSPVDLLVLSACQTGLGDAMAGEGVQGLRRSFELAGVGAIISSLWSVDDLASSLLTERFYERLKAADTATEARCIAHALGEAKDYLRTLTVENLAASGYDDEAMDFAEQGRTRPFEHPRYWAAFVLQFSSTMVPASASFI